ncbi:MAG: AMP-binding protein, partial [Waterburya sp.]
MSGLKNKIKAATLVEILRNRAIEQPYQTIYNFLVDGETEEISLTYGQLDQKARAIATYLQSVSFPQDRVLLLYPSGLDYITAFFGCLYAGVIAIPAYPPRPNRSLNRIYNILQNAETNLALTNTETLESLKRQLEQTSELQNLRWITTDTLETN